MVRTFIFALALIYGTISSTAQNNFWVGFSNKSGTSYSIENPSEYLSTKAIQRRFDQNISIDSTDIPVNQEYISLVLYEGAELIHQSKWLNGITVVADSIDFPDKVLALPFVSEVQLTKPGPNIKSGSNNKFYTEINSEIDTTYYGQSVSQVAQLNGQGLHDKNFKGAGLQIAVLDNGFYKVDEFAAFDSLWAKSQILGTKDFVESGGNVYNKATHGLMVLSTMAANLPGQFIGTAPDASYWLLRSEDNTSEFLIEEDNWVAAAEFADSVGVDIINSSLGYYLFDNAAMDHTYADMDGKTTRVSKAAEMAANKGILVVNSAGNEGNKNWHYLLAPADAENVLTVGAVDKNDTVANFSSFGPSSDGRIKPNVAAMGVSTTVITSSGNVGQASGTSFSSPVLAGMAACLWQANREATALEIKEWIEKSAHQYNNPDSLMGYGIPDFQEAYSLATSIIPSIAQPVDEWYVFPNPFTSDIYIQNNYKTVSEVMVEIFDVSGRQVYNKLLVHDNQTRIPGIENLKSGMLILRLISNDKVTTFKIVKKD